jgi:hypothetical protein
MTLSSPSDGGVTCICRSPAGGQVALIRPMRKCHWLSKYSKARGSNAVPATSRSYYFPSSRRIASTELPTLDMASESSSLGLGPISHLVFLAHADLPRTDTLSADWRTALGPALLLGHLSPGSHDENARLRFDVSAQTEGGSRNFSKTCTVGCSGLVVTSVAKRGLNPVSASTHP